MGTERLLACPGVPGLCPVVPGRAALSCSPLEGAQRGCAPRMGLNATAAQSKSLPALSLRVPICAWVSPRRSVSWG